MRQAIVTRYLAPTNFRGGRVKAIAQAGGCTIPWDHAKDSDHNHLDAAISLANKFGWLHPDHGDRAIVGGAMPKSGYCFVFTERTGR